MTEAEVLKIFAVLEVAYPAFNNKLSDDEYNGKINLWSEMFMDDKYEIVGAAVKAYIATDETGFAPNIGQIKALIRKLTQPEQMTEAEAINIIMKAARNSIYNSVEEYKKLPPMLQRLVGSPMQLREWGISDSKTINTVVSSNLQRSYRVLAQRQNELDALPESIKQHMRLAATSNMYLIE